MDTSETHTYTIVSKLVGGVQWALTLSFLLSAIVLINLDGPVPFAKFGGTELAFQLGLVLGFIGGYLWVGRLVTSVGEERSHRRQRVLYILVLLTLGIIGNVGFPTFAGLFVGGGVDAYDVLALIALASISLSYLIVYVVIGGRD